MVSLLRRLLLIYTLGLVVLIAGIVWVLSTDENSCEEQWEAVRLPKEMEDLIMTYEQALTIEERERKNRAVDQVFARIGEVYSTNKGLFSRQPNFLEVRSGLVGTDLPGGRGQIGLKVHVTEIVPQSKLPPEDRIPCAIDGVPIEVTTDDPASEYLGGATSWHRPLMAGVGIQAPNIRPVGPSVFSGTLTGLARRNSDSSEVLVTCLHNLTGAPFQFLGRLGDPLYQISTDQVKHKIGTVAGFVRMSKDSGYTNVADVATCTPIYPGPPEFQDFSDFANYGLHNGDHDLGTVIAGTVDPKDVEGPLTSVSAVSGVRTDVTIAALNQTPTLGDYRYSGLVRLNVGQTPFKHGDSGTPLLVEVEPGIYKMCCILFAHASSGGTYAFPASVAEGELGISFGKEISMPRLSAEGFVGQRWIIDDYFRAGETLHAGDVVVVRQRTASPYLPRVFKASSSHKQRVIGIVHTPTGKEVGDQMAATGVTHDTDEYVPIVTQGIAKAFSGENMGAGDPVASSTVRATPSGKSEMSTVVKADAQDAYIVGRCLTPMLTTVTNEVVDVLVDLAGPQGPALSPPS